MTQNRILPLVGPVLTIYLLADAASAGERFTAVDYGVGAVALLCSMWPLLFRRHAPGDEPAGLGRAGALGNFGGIALAAQLGTGMPTMLGQVWSAIAVAVWGALVLDLALTVPDEPRRLWPLRPVAIVGALVASCMGIAAHLPAVQLMGRLVLAPSSTFWRAPWVFSLAALMLATLVRGARSPLRSAPTALASNAWALIGLVPAAAIALVVTVGRLRGLLLAGSPWMPIAGAGVVVLTTYAHTALVDPSRRLQAGDAARRAFAAVLTLLALAAIVIPLRGYIPDDPLALVLVCGALVLLAPSIQRFTVPVATRLLAPFGGRLLEGCRRAAVAAEGGLPLEELGQKVLMAIRVASDDPLSTPRLFAFDPPMDLKIDAAGQPHVRARPMPATLVERFHERPGEVVALIDLVHHVVRRPALRPLVETLQQMDALCAVPIVTDGEIEGALVVPKGRRSTPLSLEEINALRALGDRLAGPLRVLGALARAQARAGALSVQKDRVDERVEALEEEATRLRADAQVLSAGRGVGPTASTVVAYSAPMRAVERRLADLAPTDASIAMVAEAGCFVDRIARRLHERSPRAGAPFVVADCGYVSRDDTLAALVGVAGAESAPGWLKLAHGGTLFLADVPALSLEAQRALAEAFAVRAMRPIDGAGAYAADVRVVATSRVPLSELVEAEVFDAELSRWLTRAEVRVPPLRERREDIPSLTLLAIDHACRILGRPTLGVAQAALDRLLAHEWLGNQRELEMVVQYAVARASTDLIRLVDLPALVERREVDVEEAPPGDPLEGTFSEVERRVLVRALAKAEGNKSGAARALGLKRTTFLDKFRRHGLDEGDAESPDAP